MATTKKEPVKMTPTQMKKKIELLEAEVDKLKNSAWCHLCDTVKNKDKFYLSTDPMSKSALTPICKECARKIALRVDKNGDEHEPTKESVQVALKYLNKPFLNRVWDASVQESENLISGKIKYNVWTSYIKNIAMGQYVGLTYQDSDMFKEKIVYEDERTPESMAKGREDQDTYTDYLKNKRDVIRLLSYDPFEKEAVSDQPLLYSQLLGILDANEEGNDDMVRTASAIAIVRGFLQNSKIDDSLAKYMSDPANLQKNSGTIKSLQDSKKQCSSMIKDLAAESCISLKNNKNAKKGENTWTGKIKKIKDMNLREGEVNGFDIGTCRGMQQVMDMSNASILKQLHLDESEYSDMLAEMRETVVDLRRDLDSYKEISRVLLRENLDLKDLLETHNMLDRENLVDINDLFSCFGDQDDEEETDKEDGGEEA